MIPESIRTVICSIEIILTFQRYEILVVGLTVGYYEYYEDYCLLLVLW